MEARSPVSGSCGVGRRRPARTPGARPPTKREPHPVRLDEAARTTVPICITGGLLHRYYTRPDRPLNMASGPSRNHPLGYSSCWNPGVLLIIDHAATWRRRVRTYGAATIRDWHRDLEE